jgi:hypothetical protein
MWLVQPRGGCLVCGRSGATTGPCLSLLLAPSLAPIAVHARHTPCPPSSIPLPPPASQPRPSSAAYSLSAFGPPRLCCLGFVFSLPKAALNTDSGAGQPLHLISPSSASPLRLFPCPSASDLSDTPGLAARSLPASRRTLNTRYRCSAAVS